MAMKFRDMANAALKVTPAAIKLRIIYFIFWLICLACIAIGSFALANAHSAGKEIGGAAGTAVGKAIGSFNGVTRGLSEGGSDGTEKGLSADDTTIMLQEVRSTGRLQVLVADINMDIFHMIGKDGESKSGAEMDVETTRDANFVALYKQSGHAVFTVDLNRATVEQNSSGIILTLPEPSAEVISDGELVLVDKWQKSDFTGSAEKGQLGLLNSLRKMDEQTVKELQNYEPLMDQAKESAIAQVEELAVFVRSGTGIVDIVFED